MRINGTVWSARDIAARIDHTVLAPDATRKDMENACALARAYGFKAVFTNPYWTPLIAELLDGSGIAAGISAAFPRGSVSTDAKVAEVMDAVARVDGKPCAVDMVTNIALLKEGHFDDYTRDIAAVVNAVEGRGIIVKAILETSLLNAEEIRTACRCAAEAGVDFVKTSTGRAGAPALSHIRIMRDLMVTYPLEPAQVSLISMFTIGVPGFLLALEQNKDRIKGHFITNVMLKALPGGLTDVIAVGALVVCGEVFCISDASIGTIATLVLSVVGFMILFKISEPLNGMKYAVIIGNIAGLVFSGFFLKKLFALTDLSNICILLMIVFGFAAESLFRNLTLLVEKLRGSYEKKKGFNV